MLTVPKLKYFLGSAGRALLGQGLACPSCGCEESEQADRKMGVTALRRCDFCRLLFRTPTTSADTSDAFYRSEYESVTTRLPDPAELREMTQCGFAGVHGGFYDASRYIAAMRSLGVKNGDRVLDFGASWGYNTWQLQRAGFRAQGYEINGLRGEFGRRCLEIPVVCDRAEICRPVDVFFSVNVIEHVPSVREMLDFALGALRPGGLIFLVTCNGSEACRLADPERWHRWWGQVHP
ncbi:MAG: methyltransferase domain-containing protein, partial [Verrucomicrobiae bacterium]|nr:methyltransferase domain-containing protein [Verrucomicrobiae bacterium]